MGNALPYSALTIFRASAGSGKTYILARRYIELLIQRPDAFRNILALTFTNKATDEMKMRILNYLYGLAHGDARLRPLSEDIANLLKMHPDIVAQRAEEALRLLLHHFSHFNVLTIDAFFQIVLRNLADELGLHTIPRIELNDMIVEERAVDSFFASLSMNDMRLSWVMRFITSRIDDGSNWNVVHDVKIFGRQLLKDIFKLHRQTLYKAVAEQGFFDRYTDNLQAYKAAAIQRLQTFGHAFLDDIAQYGLRVGDFPYKQTGIAGFFVNLTKDDNYKCTNVGKRIEDCLTNAEAWAAKKSSAHDIIVQMATDKWMQLLSHAVQCLNDTVIACNSVDTVFRNLHQLRLLECIDNEMTSLNKVENRFLLSDTQVLLHELITDDDGVSSDAPFIFEKIGKYVRHMMIDEFQDTGKLQWLNLRILLNECISHGISQSLIVGDVKQSIYRWRSGDWRLLNHIESECKRHVSDDKCIHIESLAVNWRSDKRIVHFNNAFFQCAIDIESHILNDLYGDASDAVLATAYREVLQQLPPGKTDEGIVDVHLFNHEQYEKRTLEGVTTVIRQLMDAGIKPDRMAILCRNNNDLTKVATYLGDVMPQLDMVVANAFTLESALSVMMIVAAMQLLHDPDDNHALAFLIKHYQGNILGKKACEALLHTDIQSRYKMLPCRFVEQADAMRCLTLHDMAEVLYDVFGISTIKGEDAFVCVFFDELSNFVNENPADLTAFLHHWDDAMRKVKVATTTQHGIRLLTLHASKGLEFDYVLSPYCDWRPPNTNDDILWCEPQRQPFNALPLIPLNVVKKLQNTIYAPQWRDEMVQRSVDRLNLLYVCFTRAKKGLFVWGRYDDAKSRANLIGKVLPQLTQHCNGAVLTDHTNANEGSLRLIWGEIPKQPAISSSPITEEGHGWGESPKRSNDPFTATPTQTIHFPITQTTNTPNFRQSNESRRFTWNDDEECDVNQYIQQGQILHYVFAQIRTRENIDKVLNAMEDSGILAMADTTADSLRNTIHNAIDNPCVKEWFNDNAIVINERTIVTKDPHNGQLAHYRPDRVVINGNNVTVVDFKFGKPQNKYKDQVQQYIALLQAMGYKKVDGYLYYVHDAKVEKIVT